MPCMLIIGGWVLPDSLHYAVSHGLLLTLWHCLLLLSCPERFSAAAFAAAAAVESDRCQAVHGSDSLWTCWAAL